MIDKDRVLAIVRTMAKVTSKLQVTVPKAIAERYGIRPGNDIEWVAAGDAIRVLPPASGSRPLDAEARLRLFDAATERQRLRQSGRRAPRPVRGRGWRRADLYERGRAR
ncbi:MAG: AbrB/MazE/SpoVT family DNA-binding domain-containing protein [Candidatus Rokubacteria bacterium]|nr:AbrB/MazE/SpoVT family DNA-binding domain-containing protein [Candidatus Rokubacteria bacterium]